MATDPFIYLQFIRQHMATLPGSTERLCFGTPAFYVNKKLLARMWESGEVMVVRTDEREKWMRADPETFFITDHYRNYPSMLIRLDKVQPDDLKELLTAAWHKRAPKALVKEQTDKIKTAPLR